MALISFRNDAYAPITYTSGAVPPSSHNHVTDCLALFAFLKQQSRFWMSLVYEVHLCDLNAHPLACLVAPFVASRFASIDEAEVLCKKLEIGRYNQHRRHNENGLLTSGAKHEKLKQLLHVIRAVDALIQCDVRVRLRAMNAEAIPPELRHMVHYVARLFYKAVLPFGVAALWLWKSHERHLKRYEQDAFLIQHVWLNIVKLRPLIGGLSAAHARLTIADFATLIPPDAAVVPRDTPLLELSMNDWWLSVRQLAWNTSNLMTGTRTRLYADLLWTRLAQLASSVGDVEVYNHPSLCEPLTFDSLVLRVHPDLLSETERIFYHYYEMTWVHAWFTTTDDGDDGSATRAESDDAALDESVWLAMVTNMLTEGVGEFVRLDYEKRIWWYNSQWDDLENYRSQSRTNETEPRRAVMKLSRDRFDIISSAAAMLPNVIWIPARESGKTAREQWREPACQAGGVRWRALWDIAAYHDQHKKQQEETFPYRTEVNEDGLRFFYRKGNNRRLRGLDADMVQLLFSQVHAIASKSEYDAIQESVLHVIFNKTKTEYETKMGVGCDEVASWPFVKDVRRENMTLAQLCSSHTPIQSVTPKTPLLLRIFNEYVLYDGARCVSQHPFLTNVLQDCVYSVEHAIRRELHAFAVAAQHAPRAAHEEIVMKVRRLTMYIPPVLRAVFHMQRDPMTGLEVEHQYHFPDAPICHWTSRHLKSSPLWASVIEGTMNQQQQQHQQLRQHDVPRMIDWQ